jgi:hypothetical protein
MENNHDVQDVVKQLSELQLKQNVLLARLQKATEEREADEKPPVFEIGQTVGVKNPGPFQASKRRITRIGKDRITITTSSGAKIVRAPKNLIRN